MDQSANPSRSSVFGRRMVLVVVVTMFVQLVRWAAMGFASPGNSAPAAVPSNLAPTPVSEGTPGNAVTNPLWVVTERQIGPIVFGMTVDSASATLGAELSVRSDTSPRRCSRATWSSLPRGTFLQIDEGRVAGAYVESPDAETSHHVRIGMTEAQVRQAYPPPNNSIVRQGDDRQSYELVVTPRADAPTYQFRFNIFRGALALYRVGDWALMPHWKYC